MLTRIGTKLKLLISFPAEKLCGRDNKPETCTCSDGSQLNLAEILSERRDHAEKAEKMRALLSKKCEGDDNNVDSCTCKDGATIGQFQNIRVHLR